MISSLPGRQKLLLLCTCLVLLILVQNSSADSSNITLTEPANDFPVFNGDFTVLVYVNDTNVKQVQARLIGYPWQTLDQVTNTEWSGVIKTESLPEGEYKLTAKYTRMGEVTPYYVSDTTSFSIDKLSYTLEVIMKDKDGNRLNGVTSDSKMTNSTGIIRFSDLEYGREYNWTFSKDEYDPAYLTYTPLVEEESKTIIMKKTKAKRLTVEGYEGLQAGRSTYIKVRDADTGEYVNGANISVYSGNYVQSIFGRTVNGRLFAGLPAHVESGEYMIEVYKDGYDDFDDTFFVFTSNPAPTSTPTIDPALTRAPTPEKRFFPDVGQYLTDEDYRAWLAAQEEKKRAEISAAQNNTTPSPTPYIPVQPQPQNEFPWIWLLGGIVVVGAVVYKRFGDGILPQLNQKKPQSIEDIDILDVPGKVQKAQHEDKDEKKTATIKCEKCDWTEEVKFNMSAKMKNALLKAHIEEFHKGEKEDQE